jgi:hypothetical protein
LEKQVISHKAVSGQLAGLLDTRADIANDQ